MTSQSGSARPTRTRFVVLALLAVGTMINYLDRTVLGIAAPASRRIFLLHQVDVNSARPGKGQSSDES